MKKLNIVKFLFIITITLLLGSCFNVFAKGNVTYYDEAEKFVFVPGSKFSSNDLFSDFKDVMPGDKITQTITVKNDVSNKAKVKLYIRSLGVEEDSREFLSKLRLSVKKEDNTDLFSTPADSTIPVSDWSYLGTLYSGGEVKLNITLEVPIDLDNKFQNAVGYVNWQFKVEKYDIEETDPVPPNTLDNIFIYFMVGGISLLIIIIILLILRKLLKRKDVRK